MMPRLPAAFVLASLVLMALLLQPSVAHKFAWGRCSMPEPVPNFDPSRFSGTWYVLKKLGTTSSCLTANFDWQGDGTFKVWERRTPILAEMTPFEATITNEGVLAMDSADPADMSLQWSGNFMEGMVNTRLTVTDTDYETYALDYECQWWGLIKRVSVTIYSRTPSLPEELMARLEAQLGEQDDVDLDYLDTIDQTQCVDRDEVDYNIKINENGLNLMGLQKNPNIIIVDVIEGAAEEHDLDTNVDG